MKIKFIKPVITTKVINICCVSGFHDTISVTYKEGDIIEIMNLERGPKKKGGRDVILTILTFHKDSLHPDYMTVPEASIEVM
jgi:hypothetical protein